MKNIEFKSQVATSIEQSKRLLELGLKKETADMVYRHREYRSGAIEWELEAHSPILRTTTHLNIEKLNVFGQKDADGKVMTGEEYFDKLWGKDMPAWSLHRIVELIEYNTNIDAIKELLAAKEMFTNNLYTAFINIIEYLIQKGEFNKDYLEER